MSIFNILYASLIGAAAMSIFTYSLSAALSRQFKQPVLLEKFLDMEDIRLPHIVKRILTWFAHISMGLVLGIIYYYVTPENYLDTWKAALIYGILGAGFGIFVWALLLKYYQYEFKIDYSGFMLHLFFAHLIFAFATIASLKYLI